MNKILNKIGEGLVFIAIILLIFCCGFYLEKLLELLLSPA